VIDEDLYRLVLVTLQGNRLVLWIRHVLAVSATTIVANPTNPMPTLMSEVRMFIASPP
jgi:hypothetical protein